MRLFLLRWNIKNQFKKADINLGGFNQERAEKKTQNPLDLTNCTDKEFAVWVAKVVEVKDFNTIKVMMTVL